jgi:hypothetical protein
MTRPTRPEVSNTELRATLEQVGEHIENYTANLDEMSKDIKLIEQYLVDSGIRLEASVLCLPKSRNEDRTLHFEASNAGVSPRLHPTSGLQIADIGSHSGNADVLNGRVVPSA